MLFNNTLQELLNKDHTILTMVLDELPTIREQNNKQKAWMMKQGSIIHKLTATVNDQDAVNQQMMARIDDQDTIIKRLTANVEEQETLMKQCPGEENSPGEIESKPGVRGLVLVTYYK